MGAYGNAGDHVGAYGNGQGGGESSFPIYVPQQQYPDQQYMQQYMRQQYLQQQYLQQQYLQQQAAQQRAADVGPVQCRVVSVHDGDTMRVLDAGGTQHTVRLQGIDAPETKQPFGTKSRNRLADLTMGNVVAIYPHGIDKYGRTLGTVEVAGQDVNRTMVANGMAWHYSRYSKDAGLAEAERQARAANRGLWADKAPVPPWEWRADEKDHKGEAAGR